MILKRRIAIAILFTLPWGICIAQERAQVNPECWSINNLKGYSASSDGNYSFEKDGISSPMIVCFEDKDGTVTGTDTKLFKLGESTLAGMAQKGGVELFEVYQLDRIKNKLLYSKSRIGTKTMYPFMSDIIVSLVGDAKKVSK